MNEVLYAVCRHCVSIMDGWRPVSSTAIAHALNISIGSAKYRLQKLKDAGLIAVDVMNCNTEDGYYPPYHGYTITDKAKQTGEYQKAHDEERAICKEVFNIDIGDACILSST